jgi:hypothetical protein
MALKKASLLVPRQSLGTDVQRLCLACSAGKLEAEPPDLRSQALPGNK